MSGSPDTTPRRAGRPRSPDADRAILDAALRLLASEGYGRMTVDAVAAEAGVGKASIYLRYRGKADLATAALAHLRESGEVPLSDDPRADLVALLRLMRHNAERLSVMSLIGTCLTEEQHTPELLRLFRERTLGPRRAALLDIVQRAARDGVLRTTAAPEALVDMLIGAFHARYLSGDPIPDDWEEDLVDALLRPAPDGPA